jgi:hypothetical protein
MQIAFKTSTVNVRGWPKLYYFLMHCGGRTNMSFVGWPELYVHTVHDRIFDYFPAQNTV